MLLVRYSPLMRPVKSVTPLPEHNLKFMKFRASMDVKTDQAFRLKEHPWVRSKSYLSMSRCNTRVANPFFSNACFIHSAIITDRCFPPVQPKAIVR